MRKVNILAHFPFDYGGDPLRPFNEELDPAETVGAFKARYAEKLEVVPEAIDFIVGSKVRGPYAI